MMVMEKETRNFKRLHGDSKERSPMEEGKDREESVVCVWCVQKGSHEMNDVG